MLMKMMMILTDADDYHCVDDYEDDDYHLDVDDEDGRG